MEAAKKILLIEDDSMINSSLSYALSEKGDEVIARMLLRNAAGLIILIKPAAWLLSMQF